MLNDIDPYDYYFNKQEQKANEAEIRLDSFSDKVSHIIADTKNQLEELIKEYEEWLCYDSLCGCTNDIIHDELIFFRR